MDTFLKIKNHDNIKLYTRDCVWYLQSKESLELQWVGQSEKKEKHRTASAWPSESYSSNNWPLTAGFASWSSGWSTVTPLDAMALLADSDLPSGHKSRPVSVLGGPSLGISWLPKALFCSHRGRPSPQDWRGYSSNNTLINHLKSRPFTKSRSKLQEIECCLF